MYEQDDETLLVALQLGQQKWGGVQLSGTDEYKQRCVEIAAKHDGIRVAKPELQGYSLSPREYFSLAAGEARNLFKEMAGGQGCGYIVTSPTAEGRAYSGTMLGVVGATGHRYAALAITENQALLFGLREANVAEAQALKGQRVVMKRDAQWRTKMMMPRADYDMLHRRGQGIRR